MISGDHGHYCPECKSVKRCEQITHCNRPAESRCTECFSSVIKDKAEEKYLKTGKRPGQT